MNIKNHIESSKLIKTIFLFWFLSVFILFFSVFILDSDIRTDEIVHSEQMFNNIESDLLSDYDQANAKSIDIKPNLQNYKLIQLAQLEFCRQDKEKFKKQSELSLFLTPCISYAQFYRKIYSDNSESDDDHRIA